MKHLNSILKYMYVCSFIMVFVANSVYCQSKNPPGTILMKKRCPVLPCDPFGPIRIPYSRLTLTGINCDGLYLGSEWVPGVSTILINPCNNVNTSVSDNFTENNKNDINLEAFPNPSSGHFKFLVTTQVGELVSIQVVSMLGELIYEYDNFYSTTRVTELNWDYQKTNKGVISSGLYLVRVKTSKGTTSQIITILKN